MGPNLGPSAQGLNVRTPEAGLGILARPIGPVLSPPPDPGFREIA